MIRGLSTEQRETDETAKQMMRPCWIRERRGHYCIQEHNSTAQSLEDTTSTDDSKAQGTLTEHQRLSFMAAERADPAPRRARKVARYASMQHS